MGLYEGEGSCYLGANTQPLGGGRKKNIKTPYVMIYMTDREPLDQAHRITGYGTVRGPYKPNSKWGKKPNYVWRFTAQQDVLDFFARAWPLLSERRRIQAQPLVDQCRERLEARANGGRYAKPLGFNSIKH